MKGKIKATGEIVEIEPITNEKYIEKYAWMEKVSGIFYKKEDIEIVTEEEKVNECICEQLRKAPNSIVSLEYDCYTELKMGNGWIAAYGEGCAKTDIQYCPFCGKKLN